LLYELPILEHIDAESVDEALFWLHHYGEKTKVIAGGTDLLNLLKDRIKGPKLPVPEALVNVKPVREMNRIAYDEETGLHIGSAVTLSRLETSEVIRQNFHLLLMASRQVATTQIRNMGTIGGNICQRPQCMYFRHPHFTCYKKGGSKCFAVTGEHRDYHSILEKGKCVMAHPSDMAIVLIALNARVIIANRDKVIEIPLEDFFVGGNHVTETVLKPDELVREVRVPKQKPETYSVFLKHRIRHASDFALASVAVAVQIVEGFCRDVRIVLGGIAPFPYLVSKAGEIMREKRLSKELISQTSEACVEQARPLPLNHYKKDLTRALVKQALESIRYEAKS
jgi:xanthine dehydrogenase YagS FAD-binding subunit